MPLSARSPPPVPRNAVAASNAQLDDDELGHSGPNAYSFCAPLTNGTIDCRGENDVGLLGNGTQMNAFVPTPVMLR
jgi:hypothetical protein